MPSPADRWIAERMSHIESSGIRKVFELARSLKDPVNLSIGQPHFDVPEPIKAAAKEAIDRGHNAYTVTQGIAELRAKVAHDVRRRYGHPDREVVITSGTSGGLVLALLCTVNPGDEVIVFDPYFVMYPAPGRPGRRDDEVRQHLPGFPDRCGPRPRGADAAHQGDPRQQPGQSNRGQLRPAATCATWPSSLGRRTCSSSATKSTAPSASTSRFPAPRRSTRTCWCSTASASRTA